MPKPTTGLVLTALAAAGGAAAGGSAIANAASTTPTSATLSSASPTGSSGQSDGSTGGTGDRAGNRPAPHEHTDVTGDELAKVTAAVQAKDSAVTVESVQKDPDGSYDVHATKDGERVMVEVSADLATVEVRTGGPGGPGGRGPGGRAAHEHTDVTGDELAKVTAAVQAKDSALTVESVQKDPDGSYDVHATKDGERVLVEVSADLATVEVRTGGPDGHGGPGGKGDRAPGQQAQTPDQAPATPGPTTPNGS